jgi:Phage portal protein, SPP1 Gp6-like
VICAFFTGLTTISNEICSAIESILVNMEYTAFPQRYAVGLALERDEQGNPKQPFQAGVDRLWVTEGAEGRFGQFEPSDNTQFLAIQDSLRTEIARITGVPFHYLMFGQGGFPSGEAMKTAEARLLAKVKLAQVAFGAKWAEVMRAALAIEGNYVESALTVSWADPAPRSEREMLESLLIKQQLGASSDTLLIESGYSEEDLARMKEEKTAAREGQETLFNAM